MADTTLIDRLRGAARPEWEAYIRHAFVRRLADGSLPEEAFRHYLGQDYLFLIHFARAYGLAVYKSDTLADMRQAAAGLSTILDVEMGLHVAYCAEWGLDAAAIEALPEASETMAYTRFVLERGAAGDLLDLHVALAPCIVGYGEIARNLMDDPATVRSGNPYGAWIDMYAGADYRDLVAAEIAFIDDLYRRRGGPGRFDGLAETFRAATRLEADFWQMGLNASRC